MTRFLVCIISCLLIVATAAASSDSLTIGPRFHHETSFDEYGILGDDIAFGRRVPLYKTYPDAPVTDLPKVADNEASLSQSLSARHSIRSFDSTALSLEQLAGVLYAAAGITHSRGGFDMRTAPSGGALYPIDVYVCVAGVDGLEAGLYHYRVADSALELLTAGEMRTELIDAANGQNWAGGSPVTLILTARFNRSTAKYADRGYRYAYMEAGAICQTIYLAATARRLGTVAIGAFNDEALNALLDIDGIDEAALLMMPLGVPGGER